MARKIPGRALDSNSTITISGATVNGNLMPAANVTYDLGNSAMRWKDLWLSGSTINLGGASIKTDTDTGAIALIPKPTTNTPDPVAVVISPSGGITTVETSGGVPAANAVAEAAVANNASPVPIDITSVAPANGQALIWSASSNTFLPGNVAAGGGASDIPKITGLVYPNDDTAANTSGGQTVYISGSNFAANCVVYINGTAAPSVSFISTSNVGFTTPALSANVYPVYVINPGDGATAIHIPGLIVSGVPNWSTAAGSLGEADSESAWIFNVSATSDSSITYTLAAGSSLPTGITLASNGLISGTLSSPPVSETTYNFSVVATDGENQDASRSFSVTVTLTDPYFYLTSLLIHADGTNNQNNQTFIDSSTNGYTINRNGNATQGSFSPFSQTGWSNYFPNGSAYLESAASTTALAGDYTIEFWMRITDTTGSDFVVLFNNSSWIQFANGLKLYASFAGFSGLDIGTINKHTWYHFAITRTGSTTRAFVNGVLKGTGSSGSSIFGSTMRIGQYSDTSRTFAGYLSNLRILNGTCLYTSGFTPPTSPLTAIANTVLLTCQGNRFVDRSTNNYAFNVNGTPIVASFSPFAPTAAYTDSTVGGSGYFDGSGDYITFTPSSAVVCPADFTLEMWILPDMAADNYVAGQYGNRSVNGDWLIYLGTNGGGTIFLAGDQASPRISIPSGSVKGGQWNHLALVRQSTTVTFYVNGVSVGTASKSTDFGVSDISYQIGSYYNNTLFYKGYISGYRLVKGTAVYTGAFTPPTSPPTNIANTSLLINFTNAGVFDHSARHIIETLGDAKVSTAQLKYGTGSLSFDGTGDYIRIPNTNKILDFGTGDFTVECWIRFNNVGSDQAILGSEGLTGAYDIAYRSGTGLSVGRYNTAWDSNFTWSPSTNTWYHIAITRSGTSLRAFVNGTQIGTTATNSNTYNGGNTHVVIGSSDFGSNRLLNAYIDDYRITKGYARYTANFTAPLSAFKNK